MPKRKTKQESECGSERIQTYVEVFKLFAYTRGHVTINLKSGNEISVHSLVYLTFGHSNSKRLQTSIAGAIALPPSLPLSCVHTTLPFSLSLSQFVSLFGLSACLPAWWTWRTCRQHVPQFKCPCVRVIYVYMCVRVCVCIPVTNTCVNLITTNWAGRKRGSTETEWPSRTPNKWDITNLYWMPLMT